MVLSYFRVTIKGKGTLRCWSTPSSPTFYAHYQPRYSSAGLAVMTSKHDTIMCLAQQELYVHLTHISSFRDTHCNHRDELRRAETAKAGDESESMRAAPSWACMTSGNEKLKLRPRRRKGPSEIAGASFGHTSAMR